MWYLAVFVPLAEVGLAASVSAAVWPDDPGAQLSVALVDEGGAAWIGGNAAVTDAEIAALQGLAAVPGVRFYRYSLDGFLGSALPAGPSEGARWGWPQSVSAAGLRAA